jgi:fructuronate reductase
MAGKRLSNSTLGNLPTSVTRPRYDRTRLRPRIVHLGVGNFHRAHQAYYTEQALQAAQDNGDHRNLDWGICGVSLRNSAVRDKLAPQDCLYTLEVRDNEECSQQVIGCLREVLVGPQATDTVIERLSDADVITLTVTEKAYCLQAGGELDLADPQIRRDLQPGVPPVTVVGYLAAAMRLRRARHGRPATIVCCDNLADNGNRLAAAVAAFLAEQEAGLGRWVLDNVAFPNTMVDRIVPHTSGEMLQAVSARLGLEDRASVITEPFSQWVIQDRFNSEMPAWAAAGAQIVDDVSPFETIKLRMLNGSHSTLAYLGCLAGYRTVDEAMRAPGLRQLVDGMMQDEIRPTLTVPAGFDIDAYRLQLLARFSNTATQHRLQQIAMDGSQKLPQRLLPTVRERLAAGAPVDRLALAIAAWILYVRGEDDRGNRWDVDDPLAGRLATLHRQASDGLAAVVRDSSLFDDVLRDDIAFVNLLRKWATALQAEGVDAVVGRFANDGQAG